MSSSASSHRGSIESVHPHLDEDGASRLYHVYRTSFHRHYDIKSADDQPFLYAEISSFTPNKPDLTLRAGNGSHTPIVAVCKMLKASGDYKLGLGNPDDMNHVQWEDMTKENLLCSRYRFEMTLQSQQGGSRGERRSFLWKRTRHVGVGDSAPPTWSFRNYKLVDERTEQLLAVFTSERTLRKCGKIQIMVNYGKSFDTMVFISCLSLYEKDRRRDNRGASGGGGGGGGS